MRNLEAEAAAWRRGAWVRIEQGDLVSYVGAVFVFARDGGGAVWVEPSYLDAMGAGTPSMHAAKAWRDAGHLFELQGDGWSAKVFPVDDDDTIEAVEVALRQIGEGWESERERVREMIADVLG